MDSNLVELNEEEGEGIIFKKGVSRKRKRSTAEWGTKPKVLKARPRAHTQREEGRTPLRRGRRKGGGSCHLQKVARVVGKKSRGRGKGGSLGPATL